MALFDARKRPQPAGRRERFLSWLWRGSRRALASIVIFALVGAAYQVIDTEIDRRAYPPPGRLVDVGGYKLHLYCVGEGSPTVILDAVGGGSSTQWIFVQREVAAASRVCAYDRAGLGWSDPGPEPRDAHQHARELRTLLANAGIANPYVLVGHSFGGRVARVYAAEYPDEVIGLVLVDTGKPYQDPHFPPEEHAEYAAEEQMSYRLRWLAPLGVVRLLLAFGLGPEAKEYDLPAPQRAEARTFNRTTKFWQSVAGTYAAMPETGEQERRVKSLGDIPLVVLSATLPQDETRRAWNEFSAGLAGLSSNSSHRLVAGATHMSLALKREHAQQTIAAVLDVVEAARTGHRLAR